MEIGKRVPGIKPALCWLRDLRLYRSLHEEVSLKKEKNDLFSKYETDNFLLEANDQDCMYLLIFATKYIDQLLWDKRYQVISCCSV